METEKGNGENREQEEGWVEGVVATRDYLRKKEARKKEGDFFHVSTTQTEEKRKQERARVCALNFKGDCFDSKVCLIP